jgi:hypothetical protein
MFSCVVYYDYISKCYLLRNIHLIRTTQLVKHGPSPQQLFSSGKHDIFINFRTRSRSPNETKLLGRWLMFYQLCYSIYLILKLKSTCLLAIGQGGCDEDGLYVVFIWYWSYSPPVFLSLVEVGVTRMDSRAITRTMRSLAAARACEHPVNIQWTFSEHSVNIQWTSSEHSVNIQWTSSEHPVNIQWTFSEHPVNI